MKSVGLIAEYNPFHKGHQYHQNRAVETTNAEVAIAVMSGNFVQRGAPAVADKYIRSAAAIESGVNLVVELPVFYALSSAETFAEGAILTLCKLGADSLVFGSECGQLGPLRRIADVLLTEPPAYQNALKNALACGDSYPKARDAALQAYWSSHDDKNDNADIGFSGLLALPNNILGIEYLKAIQKYQAAITPYTIERQGAGYHDTKLCPLPSAAAIREQIAKQLENTAVSAKPDADCLPLADFLHDSLPASSADFLLSVLGISAPLVCDDFSLLLNHKLSGIIHETHGSKAAFSSALCQYVDVTQELANRILQHFTGIDTFTGLAAKLKCKSYTLSRIHRCLFHILLDLKTCLRDKYCQADIPYVRVLGFDRKGQEYLKMQKKKIDVPIIVKPADYKELLSEDRYAAWLYHQACHAKYGCGFQDELCQGVYIKKETS